MHLRWYSSWRRLTAGLFFSVLALVQSPVSAQNTPPIEVGWIVQAAALKPGSDASPLRLNEGNSSFLSRVALLAEARLTDHLTAFLELQSLRGVQVGLYGLSFVYRPLRNRAFHLEAGKFLMPFGNFLPRHWASENPLFEFPLSYSYRSSVSAFQLPRSGNDLLAVRGQGHGFLYPSAGNGGTSASNAVQEDLPTPGSGLSVISRYAYLTGVQAYTLNNKLFLALMLTNGAPAYPADLNNSDGFLFGGRLRYTFFTGLELGVSLASAPYLDKSTVQSELGEASLNSEDYRQKVAGTDLSFSRGHWIVFGEGIFNRWESPFLGYPLDAWSGYLEGKRTLSARWYLAARISGMYYKKIPDPNDVDGDGNLQESWDYPVMQIEGGVGCRLQRNMLLKAVYEHNRTYQASNGDPRDDVLALQAVVFF